MTSLPDHTRDTSAPTPGSLLAGLFISVLAARFVRAAWDAARREGGRQRIARSR